jgi:hypothetical protein
LLGGLASDADGSFERPLVGGGDLRLEEATADVVLVGGAMQTTHWSTMSDIVQHIIGALLSPSEVQRWSSVNRTFASTLSAAALWQLAGYDVGALCRCDHLCTRRAARTLLQESGAVWSLHVLQRRPQLNTTHQDFVLTRMFQYGAYIWMLTDRVTRLTSFRMTIPRVLFNRGFRLSIGMVGVSNLLDVLASMALGGGTARGCRVLLASCVRIRMLRIGTCGRRLICLMSSLCACLCLRRHA